VNKSALVTIAVLAFCLGVVFIPAVALIVGSLMLIYAVGVTVWAHWMAWKPGSKNEDLELPDQDIYHHPR